MKRTKQWVAALLSAVLLMGALPAAALAEEPGDPQLGETGSVQQEELNALPQQAETDPPAQQEDVSTLPQQAETDPPAQQEDVSTLPQQAETDPPAQQEDVSTLPQQAETDPPAQQEELNALPQQEGTGNPAGDVTADPTHVTVTTSDEFRAALENDDVTHITFSGRLVVESVGGGNELYAGTKVITPEHRDSDEDNLIFAEGVTMLHISEHEGNQQNEATQSIRLIYGREYDGEQAEPDISLLAEAAEGWVGWYEYHDENDPNASGDDDPHAGHRICYVLYCGRWQDAVTAAEDLTANGWNHPAVKEGDDNQIVFFQFGSRRSSGRDITISRDIEVTGWTEAYGGQNLVVQSGATLTTAALTLETMGKRSGWGYVDANTSNLTVRNGGTVNIHRPDTSYVGEDNVHLGAEGRIAVENLATGLMYDENADIWCEYHPFLFSARPVETDGVPPKGQAGDWNSLSGTLSMTQGSTLDGWLCGVTFDRRDGACGWYCDPEGWETAKVTDTSGREAAGLTIADAGDGKVRLTAGTAGTYRVYLYHNPEDFADEWGDWVPTGFGTGIPGTEGIPLTVTVTASGGNRQDSGRDDRDDDDTHQVSLPSRVVGGEVSVRPRNAKEGDSVTVTAAPRDGYELASLTVTDARGRTVPTTDMGNGQYAFTMPDSRIKVTTSFVPIAALPAANSFTDVAPGAYYYDAVQWAVEKGITGGTSADRFSPDTPCSRAQTVTFLWRAAGSPAPAGRENPFRDVQPGAYYYEAVLWAVEKGITGGTTAETFSPEATVTRGQTAAFLHRAAGSPAADGSSFTDVPSGAYYAEAVRWAVERGITGGTGGGMFSPVTNCTRAQIVTFLYRGR